LDFRSFPSRTLDEKQNKNRTHVSAAQGGQNASPVLPVHRNELSAGIMPGATLNVNSNI
jgi:hypothetical protein